MSDVSHPRNIHIIASFKQSGLQPQVTRNEVWEWGHHQQIYSLRAKQDKNQSMNERVWVQADWEVNAPTLPQGWITQTIIETNYASDLTFLDLKERTDVFKDLVLLLTTKVRLKTWRVTLLPRMATSVNLAWNSRQQLVTEQHPQTQTVILGFVRMPYSMPCSLNSQVPTSQWMSWAQLSSSSWFSSALPLGWSCCS